MIGKLFQRRFSDKINFHQSWDKYVEGFGELDGEFWIGLEKIHRLTKDGSQLRINTTTRGGSNTSNTYNTFTFHGATDSYKMNIGSNSLLFKRHNNVKFTIYGKQTTHCSSSNYSNSNTHTGGWWFGGCTNTQDYFETLNSIDGSYTTSSMSVKSMEGTC